MHQQIICRNGKCYDVSDLEFDGDFDDLRDVVAYRKSMRNMQKN